MANGEQEVISKFSWSQFLTLSHRRIQKKTCEYAWFVWVGLLHIINHALLLPIDETAVKHRSKIAQYFEECIHFLDGTQCRPLSIISLRKRSFICLMFPILPNVFK